MGPMRHPVLPGLLLLLVLEFPVAARAGEPGLSLDQATALVRQRSGGRVLRAERNEDNGRVTYAIRVLTPDGRVKTWHVDAATGQVH